MPPHWKALGWRVWKTTEQLQNPSQRCSLTTDGGSCPPGGNDQMKHLLASSSVPAVSAPTPRSTQRTWLYLVVQLPGPSLSSLSALWQKPQILLLCYAWEKSPSPEILHVGSQQYPRLGAHVSLRPQSLSLVSGTKPLCL